MAMPVLTASFDAAVRELFEFLLLSQDPIHITLAHTTSVMVAAWLELYSQYLWMEQIVGGPLHRWPSNRLLAHPLEAESPRLPASSLAPRAGIHLHCLHCIVSWLRCIVRTVSKSRTVCYYLVPGGKRPRTQAGSPQLVLMP